jgi:hypothetical protein
MNKLMRYAIALTAFFLATPALLAATTLDTVQGSSDITIIASLGVQAQLTTGTITVIKHASGADVETFNFDWASTVDLHRNLNQKQYIFAFRIAPTTAVRLLDSIALSHTWMGHFLHAKTGQYWMQINSTWLTNCPKAPPGR